MLKKQTVWLLTMLSLMIVLSVYYMMSDTEDIAYIEEGENIGTEQTTSTDPITGEEAEVDGIRSIGQDELFATIRMEIQDERSMKKDRLKEIVASSTASANEINEALNKIDEIDNIATKETILQQSILASKDQYEDVLVRQGEGKVHVHVKVNELSKQEANQIMQMVRDEMGEVTVDVNFQPTGS
ncbi:SpoIIIAH-like family protein [Virgibacillus sp. W0430]|uniref:SpoIIIAH-like family protein n=1 Tax=Virgibacillus sp. W0430 TaxID=3391580 RepID=UPI003F46E9F0